MALRCCKTLRVCHETLRVYHSHQWLPSATIDGSPIAHAQDDVGPPGLALDLHVRNWRRFLELPVDHMLAVWPDTARGRYRVAVWMTPEMTGPQAARLVALHARYHVGVLGFHEEQVCRGATVFHVFA